MNETIERITERIKKRSLKSRAEYLNLMNNSAQNTVTRSGLACGNLAHAEVRRLWRDLVYVLIGS